MRWYVTIFLILTIFIFANGQSNRKVFIPVYENGDTCYWYKIFQKKTSDLHLQNLLTSTDTFHFRFQDHSHVVDVFTTDNKTYHAMITCYTYSYISDDKKKKPKVYSVQVESDPVLAEKIFYFAKQIDTIPTEDLIKGWNNGCDGVTYLFESSNPSSYYFKTYWTPKAQDSIVREAKIIQNFVDSLYSCLKLHEKFQSFFSTLKPGSYTNGSMIITKPSKKQIKRSIKYEPYRAYLETVNDTLNKYLSDTLTTLLQTNKADFFYRTYYLKMSSKNKLKKIKTDEDFNAMDSKKNYKQNKKNIRKAFRRIKIDFVHSKVSYWKGIEYFRENVDVF
ncbi:MAG: hypothetical protein A2W91_11225 [Bacteroidetes bacterium GWF2_38_335]|nr:MAG: hypothetical protein A2W91_11225 [Bacteroidetes bacterium GWF2_38_335]OFY81732.1 MAG: hypothetical protein A2281_05815 [Bacteroidetes bacterium RIFOXYA12_FULL_38_20]HBS87796.1 hypothetical protein [Bacteroidales bacterium]